MKKQSNNKGITLIALVITIIVLLILAGISIATLMGQNGIFSQANNAKIQQSHGNVKDALSLAYNEYQIEIKTSKVASTENTSIALGEDTSTDKETTFIDFLINKLYIEEDGKVNVENLVGSKQFLGNGTGEEDVYKVERKGNSYVLKYYEKNDVEETLWEVNASGEIDWNEIFETATKHPDQSGTNEDIGLDENGNSVNMDNWTATIIPETTEITLAEKSWSGESMTGYIGEVVNGKIDGEIPRFVKVSGSNEFLPVTDITAIFKDLIDLRYSPEIPSTVKTMIGTFEGCTSLIEAPTIPNSVTDLTSTFSECTSLATVPNLPNNLIYMIETFSDCTSLAKVPTIPTSVTDMTRTFTNCTSLATTPNIPEGLTSLISTFAGCAGLTKAPTIPAGVTDLFETFSGCAGLTEAPTIPESVTDLSATFSGCAGLTEAPTIPESVTDLNSTFSGCTRLTKAPTIPEGVTSLRSTFSGCTGLTTALTIPEGVTDMGYTFEGCTGLIKVTNIPTNVSEMDNTFQGCTSLVTVPKIPDSVTNMSYTFKGCTNLKTVENVPQNVEYMYSAFENCSNLTGTLVINVKQHNYQYDFYRDCFKGAATAPGTDLVITGTSPYIDNMIATAGEDSNIRKGN